MEQQSIKIPRKKDSKFIKKIKQKIYSWHRILGIITLIPVIFWCLSGVMHPFMAHFFKPEIPNERLKAIPVSQEKMPLSLQTVLNQNKITEIKNFQIVSFNNATFYQVKTVDDKLHYYNAASGLDLQNGDQLYAEWLSRYFLEDNQSKVVSTELLTHFDNQYKYVNRYLPVYKLTFDRPDGMEIYVETASSKLATYNPKSRQFFIWFFDMFHNWSFMDLITNNTIRVWVMFALLSIIILSALSGIIIYGLFWNQFKKQPKSNENQGKIRRNHRKIGLITSLVTILFAFSGAYHALTKLEPNVLSKMVYEPIISVSSIAFPSNQLAINWKKYKNCSIVKMNDEVYFQIQLAKGKKEIETLFIDAKDGKITKNKQIEYAQFLAEIFSEKYNKGNSCCEMDDAKCVLATDITDKKPVETKILTDFEKREYGFVNKRLPVVKLAYDTPEKTTYYIETSSSHLGAVITNANRYEGYSFAILHKFLFMDWAGKGIRDFVNVFAALGLLTVSILGLIIFLKRK